MNIKEILESEEIHVKRLKDLVQASTDEEQLLSHRILEIEADTKPSFGNKLADKVAEFGGSWSFILAFIIFMLLWILTNAIWLKNRSFDPYPFILLNLILSCLAALQAPIIMMSQNRQEEKDRRRSKSDFMINLKSEMEIRSLHAKIDLLIADEMQSLFKIQREQMELLQKLENGLSIKEKQKQ